MRRAALSMVGAVALGLSPAALAHAVLETTSPAHEQRLAVSPRLVRIQFDQSVDLVPASLRVYDASGRSVGGQSRATPSSRT